MYKEMPLALIREYYDLRKLYVLLLDKYLDDPELSACFKKKLFEIDTRMNKRRLMLKKKNSERRNIIHGFSRKIFQPDLILFD